MKSIVITSIFDPTEAVREFSLRKDHRLIVVGDKKSPPGWEYDNVDYVSVSRQESLEFRLASLLPYNHYCRKMLGYLLALQQGSEAIVDTDDDNIPKENWCFPAFDGYFDTIPPHLGFINIYQLYTGQNIWPRGLPIDLISKNFSLESTLFKSSSKIGIWQGLADEDPDVDAIYRLTNDTPCYFNQRKPIVLGKGTISPFNTQNTLIRKELFSLLYLPTYTTFRFTDILRGLVAQPIMWLYDYHLGFTDATVIQKRNPHDYFKDFISEIPMYQHSRNVVELVDACLSASQSIEDNLYNAYDQLLKSDIVIPAEMVTLEAWLKDVSDIQRG